VTDTKNPYNLPPQERAKCDHPERRPAPTPQGSFCPKCVEAQVRAELVKNPAAALGLVGRGGPIPEA